MIEKLYKKGGSRGWGGEALRLNGEGVPRGYLKGCWSEYGGEGEVGEKGSRGMVPWAAVSQLLLTGREGGGRLKVG